MKLRRRRKKNLEKVKDENKSFFNKTFVSSEPAKSSFFSSIVQPKLKIGKANDKYEKQADYIADKVLSGKTPYNSSKVQKMGDEKESGKAKFEIQKAEEEEAQTKLEVQRAEEEEAKAKFEIQKAEEEEAQTKLEVQRAEDEEAQAKFDLQKVEEEESQAKFEIQKAEEEETQAKFEVQKAEEEEAQAKFDVQKENNEKSASFEDKLKEAKIGGIALPETLRLELEKTLKFGLKNVRIHTDEKAIALCQSIKAQAFTTGKHIFFNKGKYQPDTAKGKHLLVHEVTHVAQQGK